MSKKLVVGVGDAELLEKAELLIISLAKGLENGVKHYDMAGRELKTVEAILETLRGEGGVEILFPNDR